MQAIVDGGPSVEFVVQRLDLKAFDQLAEAAERVRPYGDRETEMTFLDKMQAGSIHLAASEAKPGVVVIGSGAGLKAGYEVLDVQGEDVTGKTPEAIQQILRALTVEPIVIITAPLPAAVSAAASTGGQGGQGGKALADDTRSSTTSTAKVEAPAPSTNTAPVPSANTGGKPQLRFFTQPSTDVDHLPPPKVLIPPPPSAETPEPSPPVAASPEAATSTAATVPVAVAAQLGQLWQNLSGQHLEVLLPANSQPYGMQLRGGADDRVPRPVCVGRLHPDMSAAKAKLQTDDLLVKVNSHDLRIVPLSSAAAHFGPSAAKRDLMVSLLRPDAESRQLLSSLTESAGQPQARAAPAKEDANAAVSQSSSALTSQASEAHNNHNNNSNKMVAATSSQSSGPIVNESSAAPGTLTRTNANSGSSAQTMAAADEPESPLPRVAMEEPERIYTVTLRKTAQGFGLSLTGHVEENGKTLVYVQRIVPNSVAAAAGVIRAGDALVGCNRHNLYGRPRDAVIEILAEARGDVVLQLVRMDWPAKTGAGGTQATGTAGNLNAESGSASASARPLSATQPAVQSQAAAAAAAARHQAAPNSVDSEEEVEVDVDAAIHNDSSSPAPGEPDDSESTAGMEISTSFEYHGADERQPAAGGATSLARADGISEEDPESPMPASPEGPPPETVTAESAAQQHFSALEAETETDNVQQSADADADAAANVRSSRLQRAEQVASEDSSESEQQPSSEAESPAANPSEESGSRVVIPAAAEVFAQKRDSIRRTSAPAEPLLEELVDEDDDGEEVDPDAEFEQQQQEQQQEEQQPEDDDSEPKADGEPQVIEEVVDAPPIEEEDNKDTMRVDAGDSDEEGAPADNEVGDAHDSQASTPSLAAANQANTEDIDLEPAPSNHNVNNVDARDLYDSTSDESEAGDGDGDKGDSEHAEAAEPNQRAQESDDQDTDEEQQQQKEDEDDREDEEVEDLDVDGLLELEEESPSDGAPPSIMPVQPLWDTRGLEGEASLRSEDGNNNQLNAQSNHVQPEMVNLNANRHDLGALAQRNLRANDESFRVYQEAKERAVAAMPVEKIRDIQRNKWRKLRQSIEVAIQDSVPGEEFEALAAEYYDESAPTGQKSENSRLNRYRNVLPVEATRLTLGPQKKYINANLVRLPTGGERNESIIMCQGPLEATSGDFWQMVYEHKSPVIVMLTAEMEGGRNKCHGYWPPLKGKRYTFPTNNVVVENLNVTELESMVVSFLAVTLEGGEVGERARGIEGEGLREGGGRG